MNINIKHYSTGSIAIEVTIIGDGWKGSEGLYNERQVTDCGLALLVAAGEVLSDHPCGDWVAETGRLVAYFRDRLAKGDKHE